MRTILPTTVVEDIKFTPDGEAVITSEQPLTKTFWGDLQRLKDDFRIKLDGYTAVAEIPETIVNKWHREYIMARHRGETGWDFNKATSKEIIAKLRKENLDQFIIAKPTTF